ncbi:Oxidoreductase, partial [Fusarium oxysporum f. sp. albedinis]
LREVWGQGPTSVFPAKGKGQQARDEGQTKAGARARRLEPEPCGRCNLQVVTSRGLEWISFLPFHAPVASLLSDKQTTNKHSSPPLSTQKEAISKQNLPTKQSKAKRSEAAAASSKSKHHLAQLLRVQSPKPPLLDRPFRTAQHSAGSQQLPFAAGAGLTY